MSTPDPVPTVKSRLAALEAKANWSHLVTWAGLAWTILKHL